MQSDRWLCYQSACLAAAVAFVSQKSAKSRNLVPDSVWTVRNSVQKYGFQLSMKENDSSGTTVSQMAFKGIAFSVIQHCTELLLRWEEGTIQWWTAVSYRGGESWHFEKQSSKEWLLKVKEKKNPLTLQILLFSAWLGCRCVIWSCCTCYRGLLAVTVHESRGVTSEVFALVEASPVPLGVFASTVLQDG